MRLVQKGAAMLTYQTQEKVGIGKFFIQKVINVKQECTLVQRMKIILKEKIKEIKNFFSKS